MKFAVVRHHAEGPYVVCLACGFTTGYLHLDAEAARIAYDHEQEKHLATAQPPASRM